MSLVSFCTLISDLIILVPERLNFSQTEESVLAFWEEINAFQQSLELSKGKPLYTFYDGPPFATGLPHYGHILAGTIKVSLKTNNSIKPSLYTNQRSCLLI